jgi:hypothetical protein
VSPKAEFLFVPADDVMKVADREGAVRVFGDHAAVHDPDTVALAETRFDGLDDALDGLQILSIAGPGVMGQRETVSCA